MKVKGEHMALKRITGDYRLGAYCPNCNLNNSIPVEFFVTDDGKKVMSYKITCECGQKFVLVMPRGQ